MSEIDQLWASADGDENYELRVLLGCPIKEVGRFYIDGDGSLAFRGKIKDTLEVILRQPLCALRGLRRLVAEGGRCSQ